MRHIHGAFDQKSNWQKRNITFLEFDMWQNSTFRGDMGHAQSFDRGPLQGASYIILHATRGPPIKGPHVGAGGEDGEGKHVFVPWIRDFWAD